MERSYFAFHRPNCKHDKVSAKNLFNQLTKDNSGYVEAGKGDLERVEEEAHVSSQGVIDNPPGQWEDGLFQALGESVIEKLSLMPVRIATPCITKCGPQSYLNGS